jgi:hypothetical protein
MATQNFISDIQYGLNGPTFDPILALHRAPDGYVTFHRMKDTIMNEEKRKLVLYDWCVRADSLRDVFPQFRAEFDTNDGTDSYFSLNSFFRPGSGIWWKSMGLPRANRKAWNARYLNVAFCDVDGYKIGLDFGTLVGKLISLQDQGVIPPASMYIRSGQGVWPVWLLIDKHGSDLPPTAHTHRKVLWNSIQKALNERVAHLGVDLGAKDVSRIARVPGSFNPKSQKRVTFIPQLAADGSKFEYTLQELAKFFSVETRMPPTISASTSTYASTSTATAKSRNAAKRRDRGMALRLQDFLRLREMRGHFSHADRCRNFAALTYAWLLNKNGYDKVSIRYEVTRLGRECDPPLSDTEIKSVIEQGMKMSAMSDATLAARLHVTAAEATEIPRFAELPIGVPLVKVSQAERRRLIVSMLADGRDLSLRDIKVKFAQKGIRVSKITLCRDHRELFGARPPKPMQVDLLPKTSKMVRMS